MILALALLLTLGQAAQAALQVGQVPSSNYYLGNPNTGFPSHYMDDTGLALNFPKPPAGDEVNPPTMIYAPVVATNPYSGFIGFGSKAFYWMARAFPNTKYGKSVATFAMEAAFLNGTAMPGEEMVFVRIRLQAPLRDPGTYKSTLSRLARRFFLSRGKLPDVARNALSSSC